MSSANGSPDRATARPPVRFKDERIETSHGAGGKASRRLVEGLITPILHNPTLAELGDAAVLDLGDVRVALTADSFVVSPLRFPGGSIGELAANGTLNDLAVGGARPQALLCTLVIEAGLQGTVLQAELEALAEAARQSGVEIVGGDTKVVENGKADGLYITTAGLGVVDDRLALDASSVRPGDHVMLSGPIGDHGITILLARGELDLEADLQSDTRPVWPFVDALADAAGQGVRWMRDPTRGGVASALNELAREAGLGIVLDESALPIRGPVRGACEILGLDPLHIANEGQFLTVVSPEVSGDALDAIRSVPGGQEAAIVGEVVQSPARRVLTRASYGGTRVVDMLIGDPLPRIC